MELKTAQIQGILNNNNLPLLSSPTSITPSPFSQSQISFMVCVDVKHHVYLASKAIRMPHNPETRSIVTSSLAPFKSKLKRKKKRKKTLSSAY